MQNVSFPLTPENEFNESFPVDYILTQNKFVPTYSSTQNTYLQHKLYSEYENNLFIVKIVVSAPEEYKIRSIDISVFSKQDHKLLGHLYNAYECYRYFNCSSDEHRALNWKSDISLFSPQNIIVNPQSPIYYSPYPQPTFNLYEYFNQTPTNHSLNLKSLIPNFLIQRMANHYSEKHNMPESTLILVGLGVLSGLTCRKWNCAYEDGETAPICLYVVAEQDASSGKSTILDAFQKPFITIVEKEIEKIEAIILTQEENLKAHLDTEIYLKKEDRYQFKIQTKKLKDAIELLEEKKTKVANIMPKTNSTPQALEESLNHTNGFFIATADEQSLIDILISGMVNTSNEVLLKGRNSERIVSIRANRYRKGYSGKVTGSFVCFAQPSRDGKMGCIEKIVKASGATGLCERFLMISEPEMPKKNHLKDIPRPSELLTEYAKRFDFLKRLIDKPLKHNELITLKISDKGWREIKKFNNVLEDFISPNKVFSHHTLKQMAKKSTLQIMSIACNLHLSEFPALALLEDDHYIDDHFVLIAIEIMISLLYSTKDYLERHGYIGSKEELRSIIDYFIAADGSYKRVKVSMHALEGRKNFGPGKRQLIKDIMTFLVSTNNLIQYPDGTTGLNPTILI